MKVKIKDYEYKITEVEPDDKMLFDEYYRFGVHYWDEPEIYLANNMSDIVKRKTLMHELTHAFTRAYGFRADTKVNYTEEQLCTFIETYAEDIVEIVNNYFKKGR